MILHMYGQSEMPEWVESIDSRFIIGMRSVTYTREDYMDGVMLGQHPTSFTDGIYDNRVWEEPYGEVFSSRKVGI